MTAPPPKRSWWRRKRTWAAALWLLVPIGYPLSYGPVCYCQGRMWISIGPIAFYSPVVRAVPLLPDPGDPPGLFPPGHPVNSSYWTYLGECCRLGHEHAASN